MYYIKNSVVEVTLDEKWPRIISFKGLDSGAVMNGCSQDLPFTLELNNTIFKEDDIKISVFEAKERVEYNTRIPTLSLALEFEFELEGETIVFRLNKVQEDGDFRLVSLYIPEHRLATGMAKNGDSYLRNCSSGKVNWSRSWCPGVDWNGWEDYGLISGGTPERSLNRTSNACIWNEGICIAFVPSIYSNPLVPMLDSEGQQMEGRGGSFSVWSGTYFYRLAGKIAKPFELRIGALGDYNGNWKIDWCDAAAWVGDNGVKREYPYKETIIYKLYIDDAREQFPVRTFDECLGIIKQIYEVSGGVKQIAYLVGWQYEGHDTGYPSFDKVNDRLGGLEGLRKLMNDAILYNCIVSLHINLDDSYEGNPGHNEEILGRDTDDKKHLWYHNYENGGSNVYSINHTMSVETGYEKMRMEKLLGMLPLKESIHCDAHRLNETWLSDGTYINEECEMQRGMIAIKEMYLEKGIDITTEGAGASPHGTYKWGWHTAGWQGLFATVMAHGRVGGFHRSGVEGEALGKWFIWNEKEYDSYETTLGNFYLNWMYAQVLFRKKMTDYKIEAWNEGIEAWYEDNTHVRSARGGHKPRILEAWYEGIQIARGTARFLPWRENIIHFYSLEGGAQQWTLPEAWEGAEIECHTLRRNGKIKGPEFKIDGRIITFSAPKGCPVVFAKV